MIDYGWGDLDNTYVVISIKGNWTAQEIEQSIWELYHHIEQVEQPVTVMVDVRYAQQPPIDILPVFTRTLRKTPENVAIIIVINTNALWKRLYQLIRQTYRTRTQNIHFVATVDAAYDILVSKSSS